MSYRKFISSIDRQRAIQTKKLGLRLDMEKKSQSWKFRKDTERYTKKSILECADYPFDSLGLTRQSSSNQENTTSRNSQMKKYDWVIDLKKAELKKI